MGDAEWLRGIADSGWNDDEWSPEVKAMLRRVAGELDEIDRLRAELATANDLLKEERAVAAAWGRVLDSALDQAASVNSLTVARDGDGQPCPVCGATSTRAMPAAPAHSRCLHCGNAWGSAAVEPPRPAAIVRISPRHWEAFEDAEDAERWRSQHYPVNRWSQITLWKTDTWTWHPKGA
jgi:hypothetical protein